MSDPLNEQSVHSLDGKLSERHFPAVPEPCATAAQWSSQELQLQLSLRNLPAAAFELTNGAQFITCDDRSLCAVTANPQLQAELVQFRNDCRSAVQLAMEQELDLKLAAAAPLQFGCTIDDCDASQPRFSSRKLLIAHLQHEHDLGDSLETLYFNSLDEAAKWQLSVEERSYCTFVKPRGPRATTNEQITLMECSRSATSRATPSAAESKDTQRSSVKRRPNRTKPSKKLAFRCCARIELRVHTVTGRVTARVFGTHSHRLSKRADLRHQALSEQDMQYARQLLELKIPIAQVVRTLQGPLAHWQHRAQFDELCGRSNFITRQDVANCLRTLHDVEDFRSANDTLSLDALVREMQLDPKSPVAFYKAPGVPDTSSFGWEDNDLVLVFSTPWQREQFARHAWKVVCVDGTFNVSDKDLQLMAAVVVDDSGWSVPVGWILAPTESKRAYTTLFATLSAGLPDSVTNQICNLMSDDKKSGERCSSVRAVRCFLVNRDCALAAVPAALEVWPACRNHWLCTWHIDRK